jgi:hypothetical protein
MPSDVLICEDGIVYEVEQPFKLVKKYLKKCLIYDRIFSSFVEKYSNKYYYEHLQKIFLKMYNISRQRYNSEFVVIMWGRDEYLEKYFMENNINFINCCNVLDYSNDTVKFDGHPTVNANKKIVDLIKDYLKKKGDI